MGINTNSNLLYDMRKLSPGISILILSLLNLIVFHPVFGFEFAHDYEYITQNPYVATGLSEENIAWAFSSFFSRHWHPLTWLSHMVDSQIFGMSAPGHHATSMILHMLNTVLLFFILFLATRQSYPALVVAILFAIHPLHVETVAWISDRKDVLSSFFWMATILAYLYYTKAPSVSKFSIVLFLFIVGLMAKPMLVTIPVILLLFDYWPLNRAGSLDISENGFPSRPRYKLLFLLYEKAILIGISIIFGSIAIFAMRGGSVPDIPQIVPSVNDLGNAVYSYIAYIGRMIVPINLASPYPTPPRISAITAISCLALVMGITSAAVGYRKKYPFLLTGWTIYVVTLLPVIGLFRIGPHKMTDRYTYLPLIGLFIIFSWGLESLCEKKAFFKLAKMPITIFILVLLAILSCYQVQYWKNDFSLLHHAAAVTRNNHYAYAELGYFYDRNGDRQAAIPYYQKAVQAVPSYAIAHNNLGLIYMEEESLELALFHLEKAVLWKPDYADAFLNLGVLKIKKGELDEGIRHYRMAIQINPKMGVAYNNIGTVMIRQNRLKEAALNYQKAVALNPGNTAFRQNLWRLKKKMGESGISPDSPD